MRQPTSRCNSSGSPVKSVASRAAAVAAAKQSANAMGLSALACAAASTLTGLTLSNATAARRRRTTSAAAALDRDLTRTGRVGHARDVKPGLVGMVCVVLAACGGSDDELADERAPVPAPRVELTAADREAWAGGRSDSSAIPVLVYDRIDPEGFARQMVLLDAAGYETITLDEFVRFVGREDVDLPPRPLLLTVDGARLDSWTGSDAILRKLGFTAVIFADVGRVEAEDPEYLTYDELERLQSSGRWDVQLQSGTGNRLIKYGAAAGDVGPFYAYRGSEEVLGGWRERVFSDITYGEKQLDHHVPGYRPLAFAPPYGNYGQAGTNDRRIPRELLARLELSFEVVFTQDRPAFAVPGAGNPLGRAKIETEEQLHDLLSG
jgi:peptidoglycan/xylan/chitin deacetylase (PgdA/CDA1 family)